MLVSELCENGDLFDYIVRWPTSSIPACADLDTAECSLSAIEKSRESGSRLVYRTDADGVAARLDAGHC